MSIWQIVFGIPTVMFVLVAFWGWGDARAQLHRLRAEHARCKPRPATGRVTNFVVVDNIDGYRIVYAPSEVFTYRVFAPGVRILTKDEAWFARENDPDLYTGNALGGADTQWGARRFVRRYRRQVRKVEGMRTIDDL